MVGAVDPARRDHAQRRLLRQHGDDLHVRGLGAQQQRAAVAGAGQIERVVVGAGRVVAGDVECAEIVPIRLHVQPFADAETHGAEDGGHLVHGAADGVGQARRFRRRRQRHVQPFGGEAGVQRRILQHGPAGLDGSGQRVAQAVQGGAPLAAFFRRGAAQLLQECGQTAGFAEDAYAYGIQRP